MGERLLACPSCRGDEFVLLAVSGRLSSRDGEPAVFEPVRAKIACVHDKKTFAVRVDGKVPMELGEAGGLAGPDASLEPEERERLRGAAMNGDLPTGSMENLTIGEIVDAMDDDPRLEMRPR